MARYNNLPHTLGAVLQPAQQLMAVVPNNHVQLAEIKILNKDIGFIHEGLRAEVKIDAFLTLVMAQLKGK